MIVASYNNKAFDDLLTIQLKKSAVEEQEYEKKDEITRIINKETKETVAFNFFEGSKYVSTDKSGPVNLSKENINELNKALKDAGFEAELELDTTAKFVVGYVHECKAMEDSDHLHITQTEVDKGKKLQIVCGASNIAQGQKVVVAKPGAIMPDGTVIWPGELRGTKSFGMISSAKELNLDVSAEKQEGILVLEDDSEIGSTFEI